MIANLIRGYVNELDGLSAELLNLDRIRADHIYNVSNRSRDIVNKISELTLSPAAELKILKQMIELIKLQMFRQ